VPTKYKPQLDHVGFDWFNQSNQFHLELLAVETEVLEKSGFEREYGYSRSKPARDEARELINELSGIISLAAATRMDAGFKAPNKLIATLEAVEKDPSLILSHDLEPEALGVLGLHYQRADELPGTYWFDVDRQVDVPSPEAELVARAASMAIFALKSEAKPGRLPDQVTDLLAVKTRAIFLRYNASITRHSVATGEFSQTEAGPYFEFLELLLAPLNRFLAGLSKDYRVAPVSAASVARLATEFTQDQLQQQRPIRYRTSLAGVSVPYTQLFP
jgi:hypothetical protein